MQLQSTSFPLFTVVCPLACPRLQNRDKISDGLCKACCRRALTALSTRPRLDDVWAHLAHVSVLVLRRAQQTCQGMQQGSQLRQEPPAQQMQLAVLQHRLDNDRKKMSVSFDKFLASSTDHLQGLWQVSSISTGVVLSWSLFQKMSKRLPKMTSLMK